ncbi:hypothetical protein MANES_18G138097v8 [Manihot esculenta]|uniref:Uncharacterized protein n=1 Tax=Manihot esculenta TaxID=3983 RepID=A0ACB7G0X3_MANES|nr:hypothetical protein MANES_18G138097v8 [Manihot esculenta]
MCQLDFYVFSLVRVMLQIWNPQFWLCSRGIKDKEEIIKIKARSFIAPIVIRMVVHDKHVEHCMADHHGLINFIVLAKQQFVLSNLMEKTCFHNLLINFRY